MNDNQSERSFDYEKYRKKFAYLVVCMDCTRSYDSKGVPDKCRYCNSLNILVKDRAGGVVKEKIAKINANDKTLTKSLKTKTPAKIKAASKTIKNFTVLDTLKVNGKTYEIRKTQKRVYTYDVKNNTRKGGVWIKPRLKDSVSAEEITEKQIRKDKNCK